MGPLCPPLDRGRTGFEKQREKGEDILGKADKIFEDQGMFPLEGVIPGSWKAFLHPPERINLGLENGLNASDTFLRARLERRTGQPVGGQQEEQDRKEA